MPSPFPGIDPFLESPSFWPDFHGRFIPYAAEVLQAQLPPRYRARVSEWLVLEATQRVMIPDVTVVQRPGRKTAGKSTTLAVADEPLIMGVLVDDIRQPWLEIVDRTGERVVTAIELLSPVNKAAGDGGRRYLEKQQHMLRSGTNLVEIDLLHEGQYVSLVPSSSLVAQTAFYSIIDVWRAVRPRDCEVYCVRLPQRLPRISVPLQEQDRDVVLDIQAVFARCYDAARYDLDLNYQDNPPVPLSPADMAWLDRHLQESGARSPKRRRRA